MKNGMFSLITLCVLMLSMIFVSCDDNLELEDLSNYTESEDRLGGESEARGAKCFTLIFPISIELPDGTRADAEDQMALREIGKQYKEDNPDSDERPALIFPIQVELADGTTEDIEDEASFEELRESCPKTRGSKRGKRGKGKGNKCFALVFPVSMHLPDGSTITAEDPADLKEQLKAYKESNDETDERPTFVFPLQVEMEDGIIVDVADEAAFEEIKDVCQEEYGGRADRQRDRCFSLVYPISVMLSDGTTITGDDRRSIKEQVKTYIQDNPSVEKDAELVFPVQAELEDGTIVDIADEAAFEDLKDTCDDDDQG